MPDIRTFFKNLRRKPVDSAKDLTMRQVLSVSHARLFPSWRQWKQLPKFLSRGEQITLRIASALIVLCVLVIVGITVFEHRVEMPAVGGEYTEGLIGEPQFINPLYASASDVDEDLASLVYSGLLRWDATDGFVPDLASNYSVNEDGTIYTLSIRDDAYFHDGEPVRARDVLFTINAIQNPTYRSPLAGNFANVSVVQEDDKTVSFILDEPFAPFEQYLTVGIMPASQWAEIMPQNASLAALNLQPIGSGPYRFAEFSKDKKGNILSYTLERNADYYDVAPLIETLTFKFYSDTASAAKALEDKHVEGVSLVDFDQIETVRENRNVELVQPLMPRMTMLYFNGQANPVFTDLVVRKAIAQAIDEQTLVSSLYGEAGAATHGPLLPGMLGYQEQESIYNLALANMGLDEAGYDRQSYGEPRLVKDELAEEITAEETEDVVTSDEEEAETTDDETIDETETTEETEPTAPTLSFVLTTSSSAELLAAADIIKEDLEEIGIAIEINAVPTDLFYSEVIEPRNFEMLLTPIMLGADPDPYAFWHSSQVDTGLNIAGYKDDDVDTLLEEARIETDETIRAEKYLQFQELVATDIPAVFLYQSPYTYAVAKKIQNVIINVIVSPYHRFNTIESWYIKTKKGLE